MRVLLAVAFVIVTAVAAVTYRDLLLGSRARGDKGEGRGSLVAPAPNPVTLDAITLAVVDSLVGSYMMAIHDFRYDVRAMTDLAFLYMRHGWFDRAIGPLARAREIDASSEVLRHFLELAVARTGGSVDLTEAARRFEETVEMWGEGC